MAVVALVQAYPYDAVTGGDGAYIQSLGQYLVDSGHEVTGLVSDTIRGRTNPVYQSAYPIERYRSWQVRSSIRLGSRTFLPFRPALVSGGFERLGVLLGFTAPKAVSDNWIIEEAKWALSKLNDLHPDVVILCFGAIHFAPWVKRTGLMTFGLPGSPIFGRELHAIEPNDVGQIADHDLAVPPEAHLRIADALRQTDRVGFASHEDRNYAARYLGINDAIVVGMGFPRVAVPIVGSEPIVLFVGNMTRSNAEGLEWFISQVWPTVHAAYPAARLRVVGRAITAVHCKHPSAYGIELIGPVPNLSAEYAAAQAVIAPLLSGTTGVKVKVAEAMAHGRPLVTTSVGIDPGRRDQLDAGAIVANTALDFSTAILTLLQEPSVQAQKCRGARQVFEKWFSQESCYRDVLDWIDEVGRGNRPY